MRTFVTDGRTDRLTDGAGYIGPEERVQKHFCDLLNKVPMMSKKGRILLGMRVLMEGVGSQVKGE